MCVSAAALQAQPAGRRFTTVDAIRQFPAFFHLQQVIVRGEFVERGTTLVLRANDQDLDLLNPQEAKGGAVEVRGQVFDVGRLEPGDGRLRMYTERRGDTPWPRPGTELILQVSNVETAAPAVTPSLRAVTLEPWKFEGQTVTMNGAFRGRNLFGDLPGAPGKSRYDFVLSGPEGALWITGLRPRGKGFDFDVERRMDTNKWLAVTGVVRYQNGLVTVAGSDVALTTAPEEPAPVSEAPAPRTVPPLDVVFSSPTEDETDVLQSTVVRIQFSRGVRETSLKGQIRVSYVGAQASDPPLAVTATYDAATRAIQLKFAQPFERFRTVRVDLLDGITAFDGGAFKPWTLTFSVGAR